MAWIYDELFEKIAALSTEYVNDKVRHIDMAKAWHRGDKKTFGRLYGEKSRGQIKILHEVLGRHPELFNPARHTAKVHMAEGFKRLFKKAI
jgi:hypothetical protein